MKNTSANTMKTAKKSNILTESSMKEEFVVLNGIFKFAVYPKEYLKSSPMQHVKKRKKPKESDLFGDDAEKVETITHDEFLKVVEFLSTHKNSYGDGYEYMVLPVQISYYTGLRAGEIAGLCWDVASLQKPRNSRSVTESCTVSFIRSITARSRASKDGSTT